MAALFLCIENPHFGAARRLWFCACFGAARVLGRGRFIQGPFYTGPGLDRAAALYWAALCINNGWRAIGFCSADSDLRSCLLCALPGLLGQGRINQRTGRFMGVGRDLITIMQMGQNNRAFF